MWEIFKKIILKLESKECERAADKSLTVLLK